MSSWWCIDLFVVGDFARLEKFDDALPSLFHILGEVDRSCGALVAHVVHNYGGEAAIEAMVARYPDLIFSGTMTHEQSQPGDTFWGFTASEGAAKWATFSLQDEDCLTRPKIEQRVARMDAKIGRLT